MGSQLLGANPMPSNVKVDRMGKQNSIYDAAGALCVDS